jgi:hypothetical protein
MSIAQRRSGARLSHASAQPSRNTCSPSDPLAAFPSAPGCALQAESTIRDCVKPWLAKDERPASAHEHPARPLGLPRTGDRRLHRRPDRKALAQHSGCRRRWPARRPSSCSSSTARTTRRVRSVRWRSWSRSGRRDACRSRPISVGWRSCLVLARACLPLTGRERGRRSTDVPQAARHAPPVPSVAGSVNTGNPPRVRAGARTRRYRRKNRQRSGMGAGSTGAFPAARQMSTQACAIFQINA